MHHFTDSIPMQDLNFFTVIPINWCIIHPWFFLQTSPLKPTLLLQYYKHNLQLASHLHLLATMHRQQEKKMKLKKGCVAVHVGLENDSFQRFVIPISYLYDPLFQRLLNKASELYGYHISGPLVLPCSVEDFHHLQRQIERGTTKHRHNLLHNHRASTLSS